MELPFLGKGKKKAEEPKGRGYIPTDRIRELMSRGFSELDTIDVLRREGFSPDEIDKGLTQAIKEGVVGSPENNMHTQKESEDDFDQSYQNFRQRNREMAPKRTQQPTGPTFPPSQQTFPQRQEPVEQPKEEVKLDLPTIEDLQPTKSEMPVMPESSLPEEYYQGYPTEEYVDYVVQERTGEIVSQLNEMSMRNKELENRLKEMNDRVRELGKMRIGEQQQVLNTIEGLTDSVNDVNMRIAALEKAFKETLPALIESVRALSDLVQRMKRES